MQVDAPPHRMQELWFDDGSLVIQCESTQFRVHRSILAACSPVFKDMLSLPQPPDSQMVEGCPVVQLSDSPIEAAMFLKAIFDPNYFRPFPARTEYPILQGCLRLSHKYEVDYIRHRALVHLSSRYRTTLAEHDTADEFDSDPTPDRNLSTIISWPMPDDPTYRVAVVQLARQVDALWILPRAFYALSASIHELGGKALHGAVFNGLSVDLGIPDQMTLLEGHTIQTRASSSEILKSLVVMTQIPDCTAIARCPKERLSLVRSLLDVESQYPSHPLSVWDVADWDPFERLLCRVCLGALRKAHKKTRQAFWDRLPEIYGLPSWENLEKMKVEAIGVHWWFPQ
ncbi:hypothetical protein FB45DRAFT_940017 [Roridomyces roridus]|uniref:BTB domain-containing protein n=1 Tax=Roridomyces roridus TaxID=1738132 RepID=A0AAD7B6H5_9AGAR|nr:hypothetical protein FB45DRAFT_940017 [Roridomyces roridus]